MTNKIAIEYLKDMLASAKANLHVPDMAEHAEALDMEIEALSNSQNQSDSEIRASANAVSEADVIYRADAIDALGKYKEEHGYDYYDCACDIENDLKQLPSAQSEPLTDKEQRIFLAAIGREMKVCEEVDKNYTREPYEDSLVRVCREIERKVKKALWMI